MKIARIVVPLDFDQPSQAAADFAVSLAKDYDATVVFVHVFDRAEAIARTEMGYYAPIETETIDMMHENIKSLLANAEASARAKGVETNSSAYYGRPSEAIPEIASAQKADLICMASHGRTGVSRVFMGSVTEEVLRHTKIPTLVLHP